LATDGDFTVSLNYEAVIGVYGGFAIREWQYEICQLGKWRSTDSRLLMWTEGLSTLWECVLRVGDS